MKELIAMTSQLAPLRAVEAPKPPAPSRRSEPAAVVPRPAVEPVLPNPQLRLDPALGLVVLEFRDRSGQARTIPTERELAAYRDNVRGSTASTAESVGDDVVADDVGEPIKGKDIATR